MSENTKDFGKVEYAVKPIIRYMITRYHELPNDEGAGCETRGEYDNPDVAWEVAYALCKQEHERLGYEPDDMRIQYPSHPKGGAREGHDG